MMNRLFAIASASLVLTLASVPVTAVETKTVLQIQGAADLDHDAAHEDQWDSRNQIEVAVGNAGEDALTYKVSGRLKGDFYGNGGTDEDVDLELYETYLRYRGEGFGLTVGNLVVQWGKLDELVLTDNVNAQDLDQFILPWKEDRKLAAPMAQAEVYLGETTLELIVSPRPFIHRITFFDSDWALFRHNRELGSDLASDATPFFRSLGVTADAPDWGDIEYGGRLRTTLGEVDLSLSALIHHQRTPVLHGDPLALAAAFSPATAIAQLPADPATRAFVLSPAGTSPEITASYPWVATLGGALETTAGDYGLRVEIAHTLNHEYQAADLSVVEAGQTLMGIGIDLTRDAFYGNLQAVHQWIQEGSALLLAGTQATTLVLLLEYETLQGTLTPALYAAWDLGDNAAYLRPRLQYKATDQITLDLGLHLITGDEQTALGAFTANDQAYLLATLSF